MESVGRRRKRLLLLDQQPRLSFLPSQHSHEQSRTAFDEATGQVYVEKTCRVLSSRDQPWIKRTIVVRARDTNSSLSRGGRSLQDMAFEQILYNVEDITAELFEDLPIFLVLRIWSKIKGRCEVSFKTWLLFAKFLRSESTIAEDFLLYTERYADYRGQIPLNLYIKPLISDSLDFITSLCIISPVAVADLLRFSRIKNLGILEIINPIKHNGTTEFGVSDRLIRGWHDAAKTENAFPILRILRLWNHEGLTEKCLHYINAFPALTLFDVRGCDLRSGAKSLAKCLGWQNTKGKHLLEWVQDLCQERRETLRLQHGLGSFEAPDERTYNDTVQQVALEDLEAYLLSKSWSWTDYPEGSSYKTSRVPRALTCSSSEYMKRQSARLNLEETGLYRIYAGIGEFTQNMDFTRSGRAVQNLLVQDGELLVPLPIVFVDIGEGLRIQEPHRGDALVFLRSRAHHQDESVMGGHIMEETQGIDVTHTLADSASVSVKSNSARKQRQKKRKLEDVLSAFT